VDLGRGARIATAKLNDRDPETYWPNGAVSNFPVNRIGELLPWNLDAGKQTLWQDENARRRPKSVAGNAIRYQRATIITTFIFACTGSRQFAGFTNDLRRHTANAAAS
jgi:hypothetical protein